MNEERIMNKKIITMNIRMGGKMAMSPFFRQKIDEEWSSNEYRINEWWMKKELIGRYTNEWKMNEWR